MLQKKDRHLILALNTNHPWHVYSREISVKNQHVSRPKKVTEHAGLQYDLAAIGAAELFVKGYEDPTTNVDFDEDKEERQNKNLPVLKNIVEVVKLCVEQGILLRVHRDNSTEKFTRDGSFMAILKGFAKIDLDLSDYLSNGPKNAQMNSWKTQNEVITCIAEVVRRHIRYALDNLKFFSVTADEVTDRYARYLNLLQEKSTIQKNFLDSVHV